MNEYQKKKICELRISGFGYKAIANEVGLSRDVVRNFCKTNKLNGYLANMNENIRKMALENVVCLNCQKPIKQYKRGKARKFCSENCRRAWWKENADKGQHNETAIYKLRCSYCGVEFESYGNKNRKYCCHECYIKDRFEKGEKHGI